MKYPACSWAAILKTNSLFGGVYRFHLHNAGINKYNLRIPFYENYLLFIASYLNPEEYLKYEFVDYRKAIELDPDILEGPGFLWRFMRNVDEKPPTIESRADYLEAELAKPEAERLLKVPEKDEKQRMYKIDD